MAYRAEIQIGVVGTRQLEQLRSEINKTAAAVDSLNDVVSARGRLVQSIQNYSNLLNRSSESLRKVAAGTAAETKNIQEQATAIIRLNALKERQNNLLDAEIKKQQEAARVRKLAAAGIFESTRFKQPIGPEPSPLQGQSSPVAEKIKSALEQQRKAKIPFGLGKYEEALQAPGVADAIIGAGFPLLFGGGPGAIIGGGVGGFAGGAMGGPLGMALSIGLSAVGQQLDELFKTSVQLISEIGTALNALNMDNLRATVITVNSELETTTRRLIEAGAADKARAVISREVALQTGLLPQQTQNITQAVQALSNAWDQIVGAVGGLVSILGTPIITAIAVILQGLGNVVKLANIALQLFIEYNPPLKLVAKIWEEIAKRLPAINEDQQKLLASMQERTDVLSRELALTDTILNAEKQRTLGRTVAEKELNAQLDDRIKKAQINADYDEKIRNARKEFAGLADKDLKLLIDQLEARRAQTLTEEDIKKALQIQRFELEKISEQYKVINLGVEKQAVLADTQLKRAQLSGTIRQDEVALLEIQQQQLTVAEQLKNKKAEMAAMEKTRAGLTPEQRKQYELDIAQLENKELQLKIAANKESLARFEAEVKAAGERATRALELQAGAVRGQETIAQSQFTLQKSLNDLYSQRLDMEVEILNKNLEQTTSLAQQEAIFNRLREIANIRYAIAVSNAKIERASTYSQIRSNLELLAIEVRKQEIAFKVAQAVMFEAKAKGLLNQSYIDAVNAQYDALQLSVQSYNYAARNAAIQERIADVAYQQKIEAAGFARNMEIAAINTRQVQAAASATASALKSVSGEQYGQGLGQTLVLGRTYTAAGQSFTVPKMAAGGFVGSPTFALVGEGGQGEYVVPESKAANFAMNYMMGARGSAALEGGTGTPVINISTGPVMQQNGQTYVTLQDFEQGMQTMAASLLGNNRSAGGRRYAGVA